MVPAKTRAEQRLEWLESLNRPLTDEESKMLQRSLHAVYVRNRAQRLEKEMNAAALADHRADELSTLSKVEKEAER